MVVSDYMQSIPYEDNTSIVWHSVFGRPMLISNNLLNHLESKRRRQQDPEITKRFDKNALRILMESHLVVISKTQEESDIYDLFAIHNNKNHNKVKYLSLIMSEECPFRCTYCIHFANSKHYYNPEKMMTLDIAKPSIDQYFKLVEANGLDSAYVNFGGGEPLLNFNTIKQLLPYINDYRKQLSIPVRIGINTNLSPLTEEIARELIKYDVEIATSLDGTKEANDKVRLTKTLTGTYDQIIRGITLLDHLGRPLDGVAITVTEDNFHDIDTTIINWAVAHHMTEIRIDIDVVGTVNIPVAKITSKLRAIRAYAKTKGISVIGFWSRPAENLGLIPEQEDIGFCGGERGNSICVAPSGQVFPCGYSNNQIATYKNILTIEHSPAYQKLLDKRDLTKLKDCKNCPILGFCRGGCLITNEANDTPDKKSAMCKLYIEMTKSILKESVEM